MPTIKDIAKAAGVSHGTVSNVINKTGKVSIEKIHLVEEAIKKLGYIPNTQAKKLRQGNPTQIALILPSINMDTYLDLYNTLNKKFYSINYDVSLYITNDIESLEEEYINKIFRTELAGIFVISCLGENATKIYEKFSCPVIFMERNIPNCDNFIGFNMKDASLSLFNFIKNGNFKNIAFFCSNINKSDENELFSNLENHLESYDFSSFKKFTSNINLATTEAFDIVQNYRKFDLIITTNLERANTIETAIRYSNLPYKPEIITICSNYCFDNPHFKTFQLDYVLMATEVFKLFKKMLHKKSDLNNFIILDCKGFLFNVNFIKSNDTLSLLTLDCPSTTALKKLIPILKENTGISLQITSLPYSDLYEHIKMINKNFYYDIIRMDIAWIDDLATKIYKPLSEIDINTNNLPKKLLEHKLDNYANINNELYSLPFDPCAQILLYRKDLFEDAFLCRAYYEKFHEKLTIPNNMEQFLKIAEFFTYKFNSASPTLYGTTSVSGNALTTACDFLPYFFDNNNSLSNNLLNNGEMDFSVIKDAIDKYLQIQKFTSKEPIFWWKDAFNQFINGLSATTIIFSNQVSYANNNKLSNMINKIGVAIVPNNAPLLGGGAIGISKYTDKLNVCKSFLQWYYSEHIDSALVSLGGSSSFIADNENFKVNSIYTWLPIVRKSLKIGVRGIRDAQNTNFSNRKFEIILGTTIKHLLNGHIKIEDVPRFAQNLYKSQEKF